MTVKAPIAWAALRTAIYDWFAVATELDGLWSDQDQPQLPYPYFALNIISGPTRIGGRDDVIVTTTGVDPNQMSQLDRRGPRHFVVSCQIRVSQKKDQFQTRREPVPACNARALMTAAEGALESQLVKTAFKACALAFVRVVGDPLSIDLPIDGEFVSTVQMDVEFATTASVTEVASVIEDVTITGTLDDNGTPIVDDFSIDT